MERLSIGKRWKRNLFVVPRGRSGAQFVCELTRLLEWYNSATALECVVMKAVMVLPALLLQRPHHKSKDREHIASLEDRLSTWQDSDIASLLHEGRTIQDCLGNSKSRRWNTCGESQTARSFQELDAIGNVKAVLRLVSEQTDSGCLILEDLQPDGESVKKHLQDKHPPGRPATASALSKEPPAPQPHPVIYDQIDSPLVQATVQGLSGSAGPSGFDAKGWKRVCSFFHSIFDDTVKGGTAIAKATRRLCSSYIDPEGISALVACRLIALDKNPGIRPIGIGMTLRRLMAKAILRITQANIQSVVASLQLCAG